MLKDIAILTKGTFLSKDLGMKLENVTLNELGKAKKVVMAKDGTTSVEGATSQSAIKGRMEQLRRQMEETDSSYDREKLEDALSAARAGVAEGVVYQSQSEASRKPGNPVSVLQ